MDAKEKLIKIGSILGLTNIIKKENTLFEVSKLADGTVIGSTTDQPFAIGDKIQILAEDGTMSCPADGDYTLEDKRVLVIANCELAEIKDPAAENPTDVQQTETAPATPKAIIETTITESKFNALEEKFTALEEKINSMLKVQEQFSAVVDVLRTEPADKPITRTGESTITVEKSKLIDSKRSKFFDKMNRIKDEN